MEKKSNKHIWQLDFIRALAILGMVAFHYFYLLNFLGLESYSMFEGRWLYFGNFIRFTFITVVGVSLSFASHKGYRQIAFRALQIMVCGLVVTLVTYILVPEGTIRFGILHFIATGMLLAAPFRKQQKTNLLIAIGIYFISLNLPNLDNTSFLFVILGITQKGINDLDYFPLFPWLSLIYFGIYIGNYIKTRYPSSQNSLKNFKAPQFLNIVIILGRHSLLIYMLHVPVLIILISLFFNINLLEVFSLTSH